MTLKEFREKYPFVPGQIVRYREHQVEIISYPFEDEVGHVSIMVRDTPCDPMTLRRLPVRDLVTLEVVCQRDNAHFIPKTTIFGLIDCPTCGRGYIRNDDGEWYSDRYLKFVEK